MDKFIPADGIIVRQRDFARIESTKAFHILQRGVDGATHGKVSGLVVTANVGTPGLIDISPGRGYAPNNELVEVPSAQTRIPLADYTTGRLNYVFLVYTEVPSAPAPHETLSLTRNTASARSFRVRVLASTGSITTAAVPAYDALPDSDPDLSRDAKDRMLLVGVATAAGTGIAPSPIDNGPVTDAVLGIKHPENITGVRIYSVSRDTRTTRDEDRDPTPTNSQARLSYNAGTSQIAYRAPGDTTLTFVSVAGVTPYGTLTSTDSGSTIIVYVTEDLLPVSGTVTDDLIVYRLYRDADARSAAGPQVYSAQDTEHRNKLGSGAPSASNPHGLAYEDIDPNAALDTLELGARLLANAAHARVPRLITRNDTPASTSPYTLLWEIPFDSGTESRARIYATVASPEAAYPGPYGSPSWMLTINARWDGAQWARDTATRYASRLRLNEYGLKLEWFDATGAATWAETAWEYHLSGNGNIREMNFAKTGLVLGSQLFGSATETQKARIKADFRNSAANQRTLLLESAGASFGSSSELRVYRARTNINPAAVDEGALEFVLNAYWAESLGKWYRPASGAGIDSVIMTLSKTELRLARRSGADPDGWDNNLSGTGWTYGTFAFNFASMTVTTPNVAITNVATVDGGITLGTTSLDATTARITHQGPASVVHLLEESRGSGIFYRRYAGVRGSAYVTEETFNCKWNPNTNQWDVDNPGSPPAAAILIRRTDSNPAIMYKRTTFISSWADNNWEFADGAFAWIQTTNAPGIFDSYAVNCSASFPVATDLAVAFTTPMPHSNYLVHLEREQTAGGTQDIYVLDGSKTQAGFTLRRNAVQWNAVSGAAKFSVWVRAL